MFVQVIKGRAKDPSEFRRHALRWREEVRPGAIGYLGSTGGVANDGTFIVVVRFQDEVAAKANGERPEQQAFWEATQKLIDGEATFRESSDTALLLDGGSDKAGFVQVMEGTALDRAKAEALETPELIAQLHAARPDLLGSLHVWFEGDKYIEVAYFTSEDDARKGESAPDFTDQMQDYGALWGEMSFMDLKDPILTS